MSRADLAHALRRLDTDVRFKPSEGQIRKWEKGVHAPHSAILPLLAAALDVSLDWLYGRDPLPVAVDDIDEVLLLRLPGRRADALLAVLGKRPERP